LLLLIGGSFLLASSDSAELELHVGGLRSTRGLVHVCVTEAPAYFPDCHADTRAVTATVAAGAAATIRLGPLAPGAYAIAVVHDENANGKLDTILSIPREGFGFSRDAPVRFGPPHFADARISIRTGANRQSVRMRYVL
jgi:uncharacterized protein (DUF2141 family)